MGSTPPPSALVPGQLLDRYELLCPVAQGGMGQVWVARLQGKLGFERLFAIKTLSKEHADREHFEQMFLDEARIISKIRHPNVAQVMDLGQQAGITYLVLEWIDGDSLSALRRAVHSREEKIPLSVVLRLMVDTCAGLHAAHELTNSRGELLNVVHRDISPSNVLVSSSGEVKVIDFGVAKAQERLAPETAAGVIKGKVAYMSPEQALGKSLDRRSDIWACGIMLYHLLAGRTPYEADNQMATLHRVVEGQPPDPLRGVPQEVADIAYTALSYSPDGRYATCDEMQRALQSAMVKTCGATTQADVASYLNRQLADRLARRRRVIQRALEAAEQRKQFAAEIETAIEQSSSSLVAAGDLHTPSDGIQPGRLPSRASAAAVDDLLGPENPPAPVVAPPLIAPHPAADEPPTPVMADAPPIVVPFPAPEPPEDPDRTLPKAKASSRPPSPDEMAPLAVIPAAPASPVVVEAELPMREAPSLSEARNFGTRKKGRMVVLLVVALLALVGYAAYLAWDRVVTERDMSAPGTPLHP